MHREALWMMERHLARIDWKDASVLDVGSLDINGTYRPLVERRSWTYTGLDVHEGRNVDILASDPYHYPCLDGQFDVVISGSTIEHVEAMWVWVVELARVLRSGGLLVICGPHTWRRHRHPKDCWRIFPDGMKYLLKDVIGLQELQVHKGKTDTIGSGFKERV